MTTGVLKRLREYIMSLKKSITTMLIFSRNISTLKVIKLYLRSHMINDLWSFHMKFIKLTQGLFNKFHMK